MNGFSVGDKVNFQHDTGEWSDKTFTITGFLTPEEIQKELATTYSVGIIGNNGETIRREIRKLYQSIDDVRTVYLNWDCHWFPIEPKRLRHATVEKTEVLA